MWGHARLQDGSWVRAYFLSHSLEPVFHQNYIYKMTWQETAFRLQPGAPESLPSPATFVPILGAAIPRNLFETGHVAMESNKSNCVT